MIDFYHANLRTTVLATSKMKLNSEIIFNNPFKYNESNEPPYHSCGDEMLKYQLNQVKRHDRKATENMHDEPLTVLVVFVASSVSQQLDRLSGLLSR